MTAAIRDQVEPVLRANLYRMDPGVRSGIFISADGAMGKSTLMREIAADYEAEIAVVREVMPRAVEFRDRWVPVAWVTVPPKLTIKNLATAILNFYGEPVHGQPTDDKLTKRVEAVIRDCGTRLLVLDESHGTKMAKPTDTPRTGSATSWKPASPSSPWESTSVAPASSTTAPGAGTSNCAPKRPAGSPSSTSNPSGTTPLKGSATGSRTSQPSKPNSPSSMQRPAC